MMMMGLGGRFKVRWIIKIWWVKLLAAYIVLLIIVIKYEWGTTCKEVH